MVVLFNIFHNNLLQLAHGTEKTLQVRLGMKENKTFTEPVSWKLQLKVFISCILFCFFSGGRLAQSECVTVYCIKLSPAGTRV